MRRVPLDEGDFFGREAIKLVDELVDLAVGTDHPILIRAGDESIGVVTKRALLRGIQGRDEAANPKMESA